MIRTVKDYEKLSEQYNKMIAERNSLIDDLSWYKAKVSRLEDGNEDMLLEREYYKNRYKDMIRICKEMECEKEKLQSRLDEFLEHDYDNQKLHKENRNLLSEFSQHIGNKPSSSKYKYFRAKLDGIGIKVGE
ncbi:hypothetical protein [Staphylococcus equorum]|uniref:hypothetical protein n=1 Tax=Staphylococcus equorum TaxID=246432 RepID=UPI0008532BDA|nr:hypothetical protein [Staphylococcus equorum]OEK70839.1 hypothetical protein AST02_05100 [Staphylococcus equorum]